MNLREANKARNSTGDGEAWDIQDSIFAHDLASERDGDIWTVSARPFDSRQINSTSERREPSSLPSPRASLSETECHATES